MVCEGRWVIRSWVLNVGGGWREVCYQELGPDGGCGVDVEAAKPQLRHELELLQCFELPFAGPVRVGTIKGKPAIRVCTFMGLDFSLSRRQQPQL